MTIIYVKGIPASVFTDIQRNTLVCTKASNTNITNTTNTFTTRDFLKKQPILVALNECDILF